MSFRLAAVTRLEVDMLMWFVCNLMNVVRRESETLIYEPNEYYWK